MLYALIVADNALGGDCVAGAAKIRGLSNLWIFGPRLQFSDWAGMEFMEFMLFFDGILIEPPPAHSSSTASPVSSTAPEKAALC